MNDKVKLKKLILNIFLIIIAVALVLYFSLKDNFNETITCLLKMKLEYLILAVIFLILYRSLIGISANLVTRNNGTKLNAFRSIEMNFIILFFNGITPFAGGAQPVEIYYLHNDGVSKTRSTNITVQNFIIYQSALLIIELFAVIYNEIYHIFPSTSLIRNLVILGMAINFFVWLASFILGFGKRINKFILNGGIKFLGKIKIIKDVSKSREKLNEFIKNYHDNGLELKKHKLQVALCIIINIFAILSLYSIAYFIIRGTGITNIAWLSSIVTVTYIMVIGSFIPIPGGTGGLEYGFIYFFGYLLGGGALTAIMLMWRFIGYYLGMIFGAITLMFYRKRERK